MVESRPEDFDRLDRKLQRRLPQDATSHTAALLETDLCCLAHLKGQLRGRQVQLGLDATVFAPQDTRGRRGYLEHGTGAVIPIPLLSWVDGAQTQRRPRARAWLLCCCPLR